MKTLNSNMCIRSKQYNKSYEKSTPACIVYVFNHQSSKSKVFVNTRLVKDSIAAIISKPR